MGASYFNDVVALLSKNGFEQIKGGKGSHCKFKKGSYITLVPVHLNDKHFANRILKQANIKERL